ncbi:MAG TPA: hypothetical protein VLV78_19625 [Thermoanaerobaculia bacterium]|nr:hypothetical protein [Thermoanaerobaculia bacterium]
MQREAAADQKASGRRRGAKDEQLLAEETAESFQIVILSEAKDLRSG